MNKSIENARLFYNSKSLPDFVFSGDWDCFLFGNPDMIFSDKFIEIAQKIFDVDQSNEICILNIDENEYFLIYPSTTISQYMDEMGRRRKDNKSGWLYTVYSFSIASSSGKWCIYCEKDNEIAVVALRDMGSEFEKYITCFSKLPAFPLMELINEGSEALPPYSRMVPEWKTGLITNYSQ